ncbi:MAG TPA: hypothetical protein VGG25_10230 [Streptosporangiaceae bacterium]|jgi:hypothetical protein
MTEHELTARILGLAKDLGVLAHHCPTSVRCVGARGLPDLILAGQHGVIFAELKSAGGDTSAYQDDWLLTLVTAGVRVRVWRPADWHDGRIRRELETIA